MYAIYIVLDENYEQDTQVGEIRSKKLKRPIPIVLSDEYLRINNYRDLMVGPMDSDNPDENSIAIYISKNQLKWLQSKDRAAEFSMLHEVGHFVLGHFNPALVHAVKNRSLYLKAGIVSPFELAADEFAYREIGGDASIRALTKMMNDRQTRDFMFNSSNGEKAKLAVLEYQLRINAIKELESKK